MDRRQKVVVVVLVILAVVAAIGFSITVPTSSP